MAAGPSKSSPFLKSDTRLNEYRTGEKIAGTADEQSVFALGRSHAWQFCFGRHAGREDERDLLAGMAKGSVVDRSPAVLG